MNSNAIHDLLNPDSGTLPAFLESFASAESGPARWNCVCVTILLSLDKSNDTIKTCFVRTDFISCRMRDAFCTVFSFPADPSIIGILTIAYNAENENDPGIGKQRAKTGLPPSERTYLKQCNVSTTTFRSFFSKRSSESTPAVNGRRRSAQGVKNKK